MKQVRLYFRLMWAFMLAVCLTAVTACGDDGPSEPENPDPDDPTQTVDPDKPVPDPSDAVIVNVLNNGKEGEISLGDGLYIYMDAGNNIYVYNRYYSDYDIVSVDSVAGLGNIVRIPEGGWKNPVAAVPGNGYVIRYADYNEPYRYARLYVMDYISSGSGIMGAQVKYQNPFQLPIKLETDSVVFDPEGDGLTQTVAMRYPAVVEVKEKPEWIKSVTVGEADIVMRASVNVMSKERTGELLLSNSEGDVTLKVTQKASSNPLFAYGTGTPEDPFLVSTARQLDNVRKVPYACFRQTADIDITGYSPSGHGWEPISDFTGVYDGNMHSIKGLTVNLSQTDEVGLFSRMASDNAVIKRVILENVSVRGRNRVGAVCGNMRAAKISECSVEGSVYGASEVAGIASSDVEGGTVERCRVTGRIGANDLRDVAGIAVYANVYDSYCQISFDGSEYYGSPYAFTRSGSATRCYIKTDYQGSMNASGTYCFKWTSDSDEGMYMQSTYEGWNFTDVWRIEEGKSLPTLRCFK